jgi:hypothetical protein
MERRGPIMDCEGDRAPTTQLLIINKALKTGFFKQYSRRFFKANSSARNRVFQKNPVS